MDKIRFWNFNVSTAYFSNSKQAVKSNLRSEENGLLTMYRKFG